MFNVPPTPTPPDTVKAPVEVDVDPKDDVTAKPETLSIYFYKGLSK